MRCRKLQTGILVYDHERFCLYTGGRFICPIFYGDSVTIWSPDGWVEATLVHLNGSDWLATSGWRMVSPESARILVAIHQSPIW